MLVAIYKTLLKQDPSLSTELITRLNDRRIVVEFSKYRVSGKVPDRGTLVSAGTRISLNTVYDRQEEASMPKPAGFVQPF